MKNGIKILSRTDYLPVELAQQKLERKGIGAFIMDKRDSSYPGILGSVELYVEADDVEAAKALLEVEEAE